VETLPRGLPPPDPRSLCRLSSTEFVNPPSPKKIPGYAAAYKGKSETNCSCFIPVTQTFEASYCTKEQLHAFLSFLWAKNAESLNRNKLWPCLVRALLLSNCFGSWKVTSQIEGWVPGRGTGVAVRPSIKFLNDLDRDVDKMLRADTRVSLEQSELAFSTSGIWWYRLTLSNPIFCHMHTPQLLFILGGKEVGGYL
jgi:hypothetical protein